ncbi:hypothetical protein OnM2_060004 [Erysiphe neolycopersici]|uniref:Uncharacterized protein n=1 Tax=Erysiphe neolycopersici TaxID=212602 RepID=A0A420HPJ6_9PEZI|nr:hypothetical protein OnM2_060004 [Erysiphe neolycopersici]
MFKYVSNKRVKKGGQKEVASSTTTTGQASAPVLDSANEEFLQKAIQGEGKEQSSAGISEDLSLAVELEKAVGDELLSAESSSNSHNKGIKGWLPFMNRNKKFQFLIYHPTFFFSLKNSTYIFFIEENVQGNGIQANQNTVTSSEATREEDELSQVLQDLDLAAENNRACFLSPKSKPIVQKFTIILKDLINGVPTAYNDLVHLLEDADGTLSKMYEKLPDFIKVLVAKLPDKMKGHLAPELVAAAAQAPSLAMGSGIGIKELISKPGAIYTMLRAIMNVLKLRWPAFMGTNILLSMGLFVLLFVFWYCHKRGKEERLKQESRLSSEGRVEELDDDPMIENP